MFGILLLEILTLKGVEIKGKERKEAKKENINFKIMICYFTQSDYFLFMFVSVQASTSLQVRPCVLTVTAIPWEQCSVGVRATLASVRVPIPLWGGDAVTSVERCSSDSTLAWAGNHIKSPSHAVTHTHR